MKPRSLWPLAFLALCAIPLALAWAKEPFVRPEARQMFAQALELRKTGDFAKALDLFLRAYHADPTILGIDDQGFLSAVVDFLKKYLQKDPMDISHTYKLAEVLSLRGELKDAIGYYRRVQQINASSPLALAARQEAQRVQATLDATAAETKKSEPEPEPTPEASAAPRGPGGREAELETKLKDLEEALKQKDAQIAEIQERLDKQKEESEKKIADLEKTIRLYQLYRVGALKPVTQP
jgi:tetratricopeptide (TPR) repeat protein